MKALLFTLMRKPVSVNRTYLRAGFGRNRGAGGGKGFVLSADARVFKAAVRAHAFAAVANANWPRPERVVAVELTIRTWNCRHDADAPVKLIQDALETVVYKTDRAVRKVSAMKAKDAGQPRIDIDVTLIEEIPCPPASDLAEIRRARNAAAPSSTSSASPADLPSIENLAATAVASYSTWSPAKNRRGRTAD